MVVLCETIGAVSELLRSPAVRPTAPDATGLESRPTHEHWVVRGNEEKGAMLIAVRKDTCMRQKIDVELSAVAEEFHANVGCRMC